jgi:hypothetical protein
LNAKLTARRENAFARLKDAVSELYAVHSVSAEDIVAVVEVTISDEEPFAS